MSGLVMTSTGQKNAITAILRGFWSNTAGIWKISFQLSNSSYYDQYTLGLQSIVRRLPVRQ